MNPFPNTKGTYILILHLHDVAELSIGRLGTFCFPAGYYAYVGSAFGSGGLRGRLGHHLRPVRRPHWHVDYLRAVANTTGVYWLASEVIYEHRWAAELAALPETSIPAPRFGASDCDCVSHLLHFMAEPPNIFPCEYLTIADSR